MFYMVIERFKDSQAVYRRFEERGRLLPDGLKYVSSWVHKNGNLCFQLMETEDFELFDEWISNWKDLVEFEVIPVVSSAEALLTSKERTT
jgi:hypothetical protein